MRKLQRAAAAAGSGRAGAWRSRPAGAAVPVVAIGAAVVAAACGTAFGTTGERADFALGFDTAKPATKAALVLHVVYKAKGDPNAKPSPIRKVVIAAPAGTRFDTGAVPPCKASDDELMAQGSGACPAESKIGAGTLIADTGFGPPADPVKADLTLFNTGDSVLEVVTAQGTDRVLGTDRLHVDGSTLTGAPPVTPGGPPDGETAVRQIDFTIDRASGFVATPPTCPASGQWTSTGTFGFKDGAEETLTSSAPCERPTAVKPPPSARLRIVPRHVRAGRTTRFTARIEHASPACSQGVRVRVGGRRVRTDANGVARLHVKVNRAGPHTATAKKGGCPTLKTSFAAAR